MPQLNVETFPSLIFWLILSFGVLYLGLRYLIIPKISKTMEMREEKIETYLEKAQEFQKKSLEIQKSNEEKLHEAHLDAQNLFTQHAREMKELYQKQENEIAENFHQQYLKFEKDLLLKQNEISQSLKSDAAQFIETFLKKTTGKHIPLEEIQKELLQMKKDGKK
ncbi:MAG: hypothetical protein JSS34_01255 [Proteobacteria bacterium]|nr:hypothetical protein [Pseudomonadota bacterium]